MNGVALKPGDLVDRYRIVALLGEGGMGEVYQAIDTRLQRNVALKILHLDKADGTGGQASNPSSSRGSARMLREARAAAQLDHPNVVHVYDVGEIQEPEALRGTAFLAMELIKGKPLRAYVKDATVSMDQKVRWLIDIARALSVAHAQGLVHRDIKPENVMLRSDGVIKVLDFGIAKRQSYGQVDPSQPTEEPQIVPTLTTKGVAIGTPYYMSPEQMRGDALDGRADQFSWGVLAYELLVGFGPWRLDTDALGLVSQVLSKPTELPSEHNAEIPLHVAYVVVRALAKSPEGRFATMEDVIAALGRDSLQQPAESPSGRSAAAQPGAPAPADASQKSGPSSLGEAKTEAVPSAGTVRSRPPPAPDAAAGAVTSGGPSKAKARWALAGAALVGAVAVVLGLQRTRAGGTGAPGSADPAHAADAAPRECTTNAQCVQAHGGEAYICRSTDGACKALASVECVVRAEKEDLTRDDTVWIGTMFPKGGGGGEDNGIELGRRDFAAVPRSLPGAKGSRVRRPIAVVACDDSAEPKRALAHLLDDVGVQGVIGFGTSPEAIELITGDLAPRGIMTVVSRATASQVTAIKTPRGKPRTILRTTNNTTQMAQAIAAFFAEVIEPRLVAERKRPLRVALLRLESTAGMGFSDATVSVLKLGGTTVAANQGHFAEYVLPFSEKDRAARAIATVGPLVAMNPDVVIYMGSDLVRDVLLAMERSWPKNSPRPVYLSALPFDDADPARVAGDAGLRRRLFAATTPANTPVNAKFTFHYNATFSEHVTPALSPNTSYDAFYTLAYAVYAAGERPMSGEAIAAGVARLVGPGPAVEVGPARILEALGTLGEGDKIELQGAASALDFDSETGETPTDHVILCLGVTPAGSATAGVESGLVWDAKSGKIRGTMKCP